MSDDQNAFLPINKEIEVAEGVFVRRRELIYKGVASIGLLGFASILNNLQAYAQTTPSGLTSFNDFLKEANPLTKSLIEDTSTGGQDRYLHALASHASKIESVPEPVSWNDSTQSFKPGTFIGFTPGGENFTVLQWRLEPNTEIRLHRHDYGNVVTVGLNGEANVRNFELVGDDVDYSPGKTIKVKKTVDQQLTRGSVNLVSLDKNYIHGFRAGPDGAHGIDITTRIKPKPDHGTPYLGVSDKAEDEFRQIYEAEWQE